jgi:hypothetical protein
MPYPRDPMGPRKKYLLLKFVRDKWNPTHPDKQIERVEGFDPDTFVIGDQCRAFLKNMQRATGLEVTGRFNKATMLKLLPPAGIRSAVMADAHDEVGTHEWPPSSNRGPVMKYLESVGIHSGAPWCAAFVTYILKENNVKSLPSQPAWCPSWYEYAAKHGLLKPMRDSKMGDLWLWNWDGGAVDHIGFCDEGVEGSMAYYLDGNVGDNGGTVTDSARPASGVAYVIDLVKLSEI